MSNTSLQRSEKGAQTDGLVSKPTKDNDIFLRSPLSRSLSDFEDQYSMILDLGESLAAVEYFDGLQEL